MTLGLSETVTRRYFNLGMFKMRARSRFLCHLVKALKCLAISPINLDTDSLVIKFITRSCSRSVAKSSHQCAMYFIRRHSWAILSMVTEHVTSCLMFL